MAHVDDGKAVAEHGADEGVALVQHCLRAVGPAALVAVADEADIFARDCRIVHRPLTCYRNARPGPLPEPGLYFSSSVRRSAARFRPALSAAIQDRAA